MRELINAWNKNRESDDEDFSVFSVKTIFDENVLETKELLHIELGWEMIVKMNNYVDLAITVSFMRQNVLHDLELRYTNLKNYPVEKSIGDLHCCFTDNTINILGKKSSETNPFGGFVKRRCFYLLEATNAT